MCFLQLLVTMNAPVASQPALLQADPAVRQYRLPFPQLSTCGAWSDGSSRQVLGQKGLYMPRLSPLRTQKDRISRYPELGLHLLIEPAALGEHPKGQGKSVPAYNDPMVSSVGRQ